MKVLADLEGKEGEAEQIVWEESWVRLAYIEAKFGDPEEAKKLLERVSEKVRKRNAFFVRGVTGKKQ